MIRGDIGYWGTMEKKFIAGKLNSKKYIETIDEQIDTYAARIAGNKYICQRVHRENSKSCEQRNSYFRMSSWGLELKYYRKLIEGIWRGPYTRMEDNWQILMNLKNILWRN